MADGDSTGTPQFKELTPEKQEEIKALFQLLNKYIEGKVPADLYKDQSDFVIEACINRIPTLIRRACCSQHLPLDIWNDGFYIGAICGGIGIIKVEKQKLDD